MIELKNLRKKSNYSYQDMANHLNISKLIIGKLKIVKDV